MEDRWFILLGLLLLLTTVVDSKENLVEINSYRAESESDLFTPVLIRMELRSWDNNQNLNQVQDNVHFQICGPVTLDSSECFDSRVWTNTSSLGSPWSAVYLVEDISLLTGLSIECKYDSDEDLESNSCGMNHESGGEKFYFNFTNLGSDEWTTNLTSGSYLPGAWASWILSSEPVNGTHTGSIPPQYIDCENWSPGWNQLVVNECPPSELIDSDNDGYSDQKEVMCHSDLQEANHTPKDLDGDTICDSVDIDSDNDNVLDRGRDSAGHPLIIDNCVEILSDDFIDLDKDGCSRISNDADLDGDGIPNEKDSCATLHSTSTAMYLDSGCPVPDKFPLTFPVIAVVCSSLFFYIRNRLEVSSDLTRGIPSTDDYVKTVVDIERMYNSAIIKLGRQVKLRLSGSRKQKLIERKRQLVIRAIDLILLQRKIRRADFLGRLSALICLFFVISATASVGLTIFIEERNEDLIIQNSDFHPTWWDTEDYQQYLANGMKNEAPPNYDQYDASPTDSVVLMFNENWTTQSSIFENHITTDCSKRNSGGYTVQADNKQSDRKSAKDSCDFSISLPTLDGGAIKIITEGAVMNGWFLTDPSIDILVNGESIASGSADERLLESGGPTGQFTKSGKNSITITASLFSDKDQFHIIGIEVWGLYRGLVIDPETSDSLNAEILNGEKVIEQLNRHQTRMLIFNVIAGTVLIGVFQRAYMEKMDGQSDIDKNLIVLNQILLKYPQKRENTTQTMPLSKLKSKIIKLSDRELAHFARELGIMHWDGKCSLQWEFDGIVTKKVLAKMPKKDLIGIFHYEKSFDKKRVAALNELDGPVNKQTKKRLVQLLYAMILRVGLELQVIDVLSNHANPQQKFEWFENEPWNEHGMEKQMILVTGEKVPHTFPLECGNHSLDDHDAVLHTMLTYKAMEKEFNLQIEDIFEKPFCLLGTECEVEGCNSDIQLRMIPTTKIRINARGNTM
jgi:hypothetical protein